MNFAWSLKPVFIWFTAISGIDLDLSRQQPRWTLYLSTFLCAIFVVCLCVPCAVWQIVEGVFYNDESITDSIVFKINIKIILIVEGILNVFFCIYIIVSLLGKWKPLWERLQELQDVLGDESELYGQLRRGVTLGLILIVMVSMVTMLRWFSCAVLKKWQKYSNSIVHYVLKNDGIEWQNNGLAIWLFIIKCNSTIKIKKRIWRKLEILKTHSSASKDLLI